MTRLRGLLSGYKDAHRRIPRTVYFFCALWFFYCVIELSDAGIGFDQWFVVFILAAAWMLVWMFRLIVYVFKERRTKRVSRLRNWVFEPVLLLLVFLISAHWPLPHLRLALSIPAMDEYAAGVRSGRISLDEGNHRPPRRVGLYVVGSTMLFGDGTVGIITSASGLWDSAGFAQPVLAEPAARNKRSFKHVLGKWWRWEERF